VTRPAFGRVAPEHWRTAGEPAPDRGPATARIAVDLLGGDHAPAVVVDGALRACQADPALHLLLVGPLDAAGAVLAALDPADHDRIRTLPLPSQAPPAKAGRKPPAEAGRKPSAEAGRKPPVKAGDKTPESAAQARSEIESGVRTAVLAVAQGLADAVVSAGNTGATVTSAALGLGRWPGVRRPPLAAVLPTESGRLVLLDVGSSVDPDEQTLATHARLGAAYASIVHEIAAPRIGLLTIGTEQGKGDRLRRALPAVLSRLALPAGARYVGLVEGNDVVLGSAADVVVTDGFTGNVLLKGLETAYARIGPPGPTELVPPRAAILLGVEGVVVVCHGAAESPDVAAGIALAADLHRRAAVAAIEEMINEVSP
jgi:glycerol-3-phosphate acyltransferase PlsX